MPDHLWFVPVTGGSRREIETVLRPGFGGTDDTNVQWDFSAFPVLPIPRVEIACLTMSSFTTFIPGDETPFNAAALRQCYGSWSWRSCASGDPLRIITGGQLMVGTVFSRDLPTVIGPPPGGSVSWATVDVWAKFRIMAANINVLSAVYLAINDSGAQSLVSPNLLGVPPWPPLNTWVVAYMTGGPNWSGWDSDNLRVTINFQGTTAAANVGLVTVDIEWFAIRLSDQFPP